jgi:hypothetical protein
MSLEELPFEITHEINDGVLIADDTEWDGDTEYADIMEDDWTTKARRPSVKGAVTIFGDKIDLGRETQNHFAEYWGPKADEAGINRLAFVSEGIQARAIGANIDTAETSVEIFNDVDKAIEWARSA